MLLVRFVPEVASVKLEGKEEKKEQMERQEEEVCLIPFLYSKGKRRHVGSPLIAQNAILGDSLVGLSLQSLGPFSRSPFVALCQLKCNLVVCAPSTIFKANGPLRPPMS